MDKEYMYYADDGTKFSSVTERDKYNNKLKEENEEDEKDSSS